MSAVLRSDPVLSKSPLGQILLDNGWVTQRDLEQALREQSQTGQKLGTILLEQKKINAEQLQSALQQQIGVKLIELDLVEADPEVLALLPLDLIRRYQVVPLHLEGGKLVIVTPDPLNVYYLDGLRFYLKGYKLSVRGCSPESFTRFVSRNFHAKTAMDEILLRRENQKQAKAAATEETDFTNLSADERQIVQASEDSPIVAMCNLILKESLNLGASDIHIEAGELTCRVRFRVDGRLQLFLEPPKDVLVPLVARLKIMSHLNIANTRTPQDGRFSIKQDHKDVHFRISTRPGAHGEKVVMRILKPNEALSSLDDLGLEPEELVVLKRCFELSQGLILVTGPTGSGKTTTIHTGLAHINSIDVNIVTLEDPVEVTIPGINHVAIQNSTGLTYAGVLNAILRQDPDVIFVGEIRDEAVANIAMKAALTGHLVLSTTHTTSAIETIIRMDDLGVPAYLLASALVLVIAQRLVRKVCQHCAEPHMPTPTQLVMLGINPDAVGEARFMKGAGCARCNGSGYRGRLGVYEMLRVSSEVRELVRTKASPNEIAQVAQEQGMSTLMQSGVRKLRQGLVTAEELIEVLYREN